MHHGASDKCDAMTAKRKNSQLDGAIGGVEKKSVNGIVCAIFCRMKVFWRVFDAIYKRTQTERKREIHRDRRMLLNGNHRRALNTTLFSIHYSHLFTAIIDSSAHLWKWAVH